eukprot:6339333-Pyramimonas_sp.AAC.1
MEKRAAFKPNPPEPEGGRGGAESRRWSTIQQRARERDLARKRDPTGPSHRRLQRLIEATVVNLNWDSNLADDQQWALWHSLKERSSEPFPLRDLLEQQVQFYETRALKQAQD